MPFPDAPSGSPIEYGSGVAVYDINGDGWDDVTFPGTPDSMYTYMNQQGSFQLHRLFPAGGKEKTIAFGDYDNDGDADAVVTEWLGRPKLYRQDAPLQFTNVTQNLNTPGASNFNYFGSGASWADIDSDGYLDIFISNYSFSPSSYCFYYHNNGNGTFTETAFMAGLYTPGRLSLQSVVADFNLDGQPDVWVTNDRVPTEQLFVQQDDDSFLMTVPDASIDSVLNSMTASVCDYDHDGDLDMYITNLPDLKNRLFTNQGDATFIENNHTFNIGADHFCWGACWIDFDNDTWADLYVANREVQGPQMPDFFFRNQQTIFTNMAANFGLGAANGTYAVAKGDLNGDLFPDLVFNYDLNATANYWLAAPNANHAVKLTLQGTVSNRDAVGAQINYTIGGYELLEYTISGENYLGQNSQHKILPIGSYEQIDHLKIIWPSGIKEHWFNVPADSNYRLVEGQGGRYFFPWADTLRFCPNESFLFTVPEAQSMIVNGSPINGNSIEVSTEGEFFATLVMPDGSIVRTDTCWIEFYEPTEYMFGTSAESCSGAENGTVTWNIIPNDYSVDVFLENTLVQSPLEQLQGGVYAFRIQTEVGCAIDTVITIPTENTMQVDWNLPTVFCASDTAALLLVLPVDGAVTPYHVWLDFDNVVIDSLTTSSADEVSFYLPQGNYQLSVQDALGCRVVNDVEIAQQPSFNVQLTSGQWQGTEWGSAQLNPADVASMYEILWSTGEENVVHIDSLVSGSYSVQLTDQYGCTELLSVQVPVYMGLDHYALTDCQFFAQPLAVHCSSSIAQLRLFDASGRLLFEGDQLPSERTFPSGLYFIRVELENTEQGFFKMYVP